MFSHKNIGIKIVKSKISKLYKKKIIQQWPQKFPSNQCKQKKFPPSYWILYCQCQSVGNNATGNNCVRLQHSINVATIVSALVAFDLRFFFCFDIVFSSGFVRCRFCGLLPGYICKVWPCLSKKWKMHFLWTQCFVGSQ